MSENINDAKTETICFTLRSTEHAQNYIKWDNSNFWDIINL